MVELFGPIISQKQALNPGDLRSSCLSGSPERPGINHNQVVQEWMCLYQTTQAAYEQSRTLQMLLRPFLPHTTWREAIGIAQRGERTFPTKTRVASILRLDIEGFTEICDNHPLADVLTELNLYLERPTQIVYRYQGDINKYLGDGFLSVFDEAEDAVRAGCEIQQTVADFNQRQAVSGRICFHTRIGIDTGQVAVVNLGSAARQDRTVIGMPVNLADRLQAETPVGRVWLSQATFNQLRIQTGYRQVGSVSVKGRRAPVSIYEKRIEQNI